MKRFIAVVAIGVLAVALWPKVAGGDTQGKPPTQAQCLARVEPILKAELAAHPMKGYTVAEAVSKLTQPNAPCSGNTPSAKGSVMTGTSTFYWHHSLQGEICGGPGPCYVPPNVYEEYFYTWWGSFPATKTAPISVRNSGPPVCTTHAILPLYSIDSTGCYYVSGYAGGGSNPYIVARHLWTLTFGWGPFAVHWYYWYWQDLKWNGSYVFGCREC
jgi:hypothetical protein